VFLAKIGLRAVANITRIDVDNYIRAMVEESVKEMLVYLFFTLSTLSVNPICVSHHPIINCHCLGYSLLIPMVQRGADLDQVTLHLHPLPNTRDRNTKNLATKKLSKAVLALRRWVPDSPVFGLLVSRVRGSPDSMGYRTF
jgi:hypothetical protein